MKNNRLNLLRDKRASSPAFSTVILTAAGIVMVLVALNYGNNLLNAQMAQNEFNANKQFMLTAGQQIDDIAWTLDRTESTNYLSKIGTLKFEPSALSYSFRVHSSSGWEDLSVNGDTGIILFNIPISSYSLGNDSYFEPVPYSVNCSFLKFNSSAPVSQVMCEQKLPMTDGSYSRIVLAPTMRVLSSMITGTQQGSTSYFKFYLPILVNGASFSRYQSLTMTGQGITKVTRNGVDQVIITVTFPSESSGFDSSFFRFNSTTITLNEQSSPAIPPDSVVEFYIGEVSVTLGQV